MSIGKKILSAFIEVEEDTSEKKLDPNKNQVSNSTVSAASYTTSGVVNDAVKQKFKDYFDKLMTSSNIQGPDYYEFNKMIEAMNAIADEKTRFNSAFAGLSVQGLDKTRLIDTAQQYLQILDHDAANFNSTIDTALEEKVEQKKEEIKSKAKRIEDLKREIDDCNNRILLLSNEIKENEEKLSSNSTAYTLELQQKKTSIQSDIEKIKKYIQ